MPDRTALLFTGLQNDFCHPRGALALGGRDLGAIQKMLPAARRLLHAAREAGVLVLHVAELALADGLSDSKTWARRRAGVGGTGLVAAEGTWGQRFLDGFEPLPNEPSVTRFRPTSMSDARTEVLLRSSGVRTLIVAGLETHLSVLSTVVDAVCRDYTVVVPIDCVAGTLHDLHESALAVLPAWAELVTSSDIIGGWAALHNGKRA